MIALEAAYQVHGGNAVWKEGADATQRDEKRRESATTYDTRTEMLQR